ncbi:hypothetical protein [Streptomyces sp. NPDC001933]|uniref:hypothetical protein n=1 Tax=Streptomyces sp. NPDC001933 TaxID=3364626 RepID=UPI00368F94BF
MVKLSAILLAVPSGGWQLPDQYDGLGCGVNREVRRLNDVGRMGLRVRAHGTGPGLLTWAAGLSFD